MIRSNCKIFICFFMLIGIAFFAMPVSASNNNNYNDRITKNTDIINQSNNMNNLSRIRYSDKYLKDLKETNYKGLSAKEQQTINVLATNILQEELSLSNNQKIEMFYNWILNNFYYYQTPNKILGNNCNNPYYLYKSEYKNTGKIRANSNGYASMLVALARSQGIEARILGTYYKQQARINYIAWSGNFTEKDINHMIVQVYLNNEWIILDPAADSYQQYDEINLYQKLSRNKRDYLNPEVNELSKSHLIIKYYPGLKNIKYVTNATEKQKVQTFLNKIRTTKKNGYKVNSVYNTSYPETWFSYATNASGDGLGNFSKIYWQSYKELYGSLNLSNFDSLKVLSVTNNKITNLDLSNCDSLTYVKVYNNKINKLVATGSSNLLSLSAKNNPATYIKYNFGKTKRVAIINSGKGGTVSVNYYKNTKGQYIHNLNAKPQSGYIFLGWYSNGHKISSKKSIYKNITTSFTYTALYKKRPTTYIYISIKNQKLWFYKNKELFLSSNIVSGNKGITDTPKGTFKIRSKATDIHLIGEDYKTWVNYWMLFNSGYQIGLHDATWRSSFGGNIYKYDGSHGCINLPFNIAKKIYRNAPVGTPVIVK